MICLANLAARMDIDIMDAVASKLESNRHKYPVEKAKGHARKYNDEA